MSLQARDLAGVGCRRQSPGRFGYSGWSGRLWIDLFRWFWAREEWERQRFRRHLGLIRGAAPALPLISVRLTRRLLWMTSSRVTFRTSPIPFWEIRNSAPRKWIPSPFSRWGLSV